MAKDLNYYFNNLPECLRKEIFSNIIPDSRNIKFHKYYPNTFHEKNLETTYECEQSSIQFLIHPSGRNSDHKIYKENIDGCVRDFKKNMKSSTDREQFIKEFFEPAYLQTIKN